MNLIPQLGAMGGMIAALLYLHAPAPGTAPKYTDAQILALLDEADVADSTAGALAAQYANASDVRDFAKMMMSDHHTLRLEGQKVAQILNITPAAPQNDPVKDAAMREMGAIMAAGNGRVFDKTYMDQEVAVHEQVIDLVNKAHPQHPEVQHLVTTAMSYLRNHLTKAREVDSKLGAPRT